MRDILAEPGYRITGQESSRRVPASIRVKVTLGVVLPLIVILGIFTTIEYRRHRQVVLSNMTTLAAYSGRVIEADMRHAMLESDFDEVQALLDALGTDTEQFRVIYLLDTQGEVIFAPNGENVGLHLDNTEPDCQPCHRLPVDQRPASIIVTDTSGQRVFRSMHPIENGPECAACHGMEKRLRGLLLTDISLAPLESSLAADLRENLLWWIVTILITIVVVNLVVNQTVLRRVEKLTATIRHFGQEGRTPEITSSRPDEIGQLTQAFEQMAQRVTRRDTENQALSSNLRKQSARRSELLKRLNTAQEEERKRVARELHDQLGQALSGLAFRAEAMGEYIPPEAEKAHESLEQIRSLTRETTHRMYRLIMDLRPSALDDLGLAVAVRAYANRLLPEEGIGYALETSHMSHRLPPLLETTAYRVFQEALGNVVRHSGARHVSITLRQQDGYFEGELVDDGQGFDLDEVELNGSSPRGLGLLGMQERISQCGGHLTITSQPGSGTRIRFNVPLGGNQ